MAKIKRAVCNSGPLIHLAQINSLAILRIIRKIYIPNEVFNEVCQSGMPGSKEIKSSKLIVLKRLRDSSKDLAKIISEKYSLGLGESQCIALAKQEGIKLFLTDDLLARTVAPEFGLDVHGSVGIILRAFREKFISKKQAVQTVINLNEKSSLFITSDLVNHIIKEIGKYGKRKK